MAEPIAWKSKIVLVKGEGSNYGIDPGPTGAANAVLLTDIQLQPMEGEEVSRNLELPYMGAQETFVTAVRAVLSGSFELVGSGTAGTAPAWAAMLRACGVAEIITAGTSVEYVPVTDGHESVGIHFWIGPSRHILLGSRGTAVISVNANGIPVCRVTLTGLFVLPADQARPTVDLSNFQLPQVASKTNTPGLTIAGLSFVTRSFQLDLGCQVEPRMLIGVERIVIVDKAETIQMTVEAVPLSTYNPYLRAQSNTRTAIIIDHGTIAGKRVRIAAGQAVQRRPTGFENSQNVTEWPLGFVPLPAAGNDQWKITLT